jgi:hypothetical protein
MRGRFWRMVRVVRLPVVVAALVVTQPAGSVHARAQASRQSAGEPTREQAVAALAAAAEYVLRADSLLVAGAPATGKLIAGRPEPAGIRVQVSPRRNPGVDPAWADSGSAEIAAILRNRGLGATGVHASGLRRVCPQPIDSVSGRSVPRCDFHGELATAMVMAYPEQRGDRVVVEVSLFTDARREDGSTHLVSAVLFMVHGTNGWAVAGIERQTGR